MSKKKKKSKLSQFTPKEQQQLQELKQLTKLCVTEGAMRARTIINPNDETTRIFTKHQLKLAGEYFRFGIESGILGIPEDKVMSGNIIKLPDDGLPDTEDMIKNLAETMLMSDMMLYMIPCFETGVLVNPEGQSTQYTHWTVNSVNLEKKLYELTLHVYTKAKDDKGYI